MRNLPAMVMMVVAFMMPPSDSFYEGPGIVREESGLRWIEPDCDSTGIEVALSEVITIDRIDRGPDPRHSKINPFNASLAAGPAGTMVMVWIRRPDEPGSPPEISDLVTSTWDESGWSQPVVVRENVEISLPRPAVYIDGSGTSYFVWREGEEWPPQLVGRTWSGEEWSEVRPLTDRRDIYENPVQLVLDPTGDLHVFWVDGREMRWTWSDWVHPKEEVSKVYTRPFTADPRTSAIKVTPRGKYHVVFMDAVRTGERGFPEIVYFSLPAKDLWESTGRGRGFYLARHSGRKWEKRIPLLTGTSREDDEIFSLEAFRRKDGDLVIIYGSIPVAGTHKYDLSNSQIKLLTVPASGEPTIEVLTAGFGWTIRDKSNLLGDVAPDGSITIVYYVNTQRWNEKDKTWWDAPGIAERLYYMRIEDGACSASEMVTDAASKLSRFAVAVDDQGRTHVVWEEEIGTELLLKHRTVSTN